MKLTPFGKLVRLHRLNLDVSLTTMSEKVGVSSAFASAVETGAKKIPAGYTAKVAAALRLDEIEIAELNNAAELSANEVVIPLGRATTRADRELVTMFARRFTNLPEQAKGDIRDLLRGGHNDE